MSDEVKQAMGRALSELLAVAAELVRCAGTDEPDPALTLRMQEELRLHRRANVRRANRIKKAVDSIRIALKHPADDGEALTCDWARQQVAIFCGFEKDGRLEIERLNYYHFDDAATCSTDVKLKTRGEFRQLCRMLNITLKPSDQETE